MGYMKDVCINLQEKLDEDYWQEAEVTNHGNKATQQNQGNEKMKDNKKERGGCTLPKDTATTQVYNNSQSSKKQPKTIAEGLQTADAKCHEEAICSIFEAPVNNTTRYVNVSWRGLFDKLTGAPTILSDNNHTEKAKNGAYFVRGLINGERNDDNLGECSAVILDVDTPINDEPMPTPLESHTALKDVTHAVHSSATPGRSRIIILMEPYDKAQTDQMTYAAYQLCTDKGLKFAFAGESKTKSQPWFLPQTTNPEQHQAFGTFSGTLFNSSMVKNLNQLPDKKLHKPKKITGEHNPLRDFIDDLENGTIHETVKKYAGWLRRTSNLSIKQIFDNIGVLIDEHCSNTAKIDRWHESEREGLEGWFVNNVNGGEFTKFSSQDSPEDILQKFEVTNEYVDGLGEEKWLFPNLVIAGHILVIIAMPGGGKTSIFFYFVAATIVGNGAKVFYVDADSPTSEHKTMKKFADKNGFIFINPTVNVGTGVQDFVQTLHDMVENGVNLSGYVFVFDTLKKFTDLMSKQAVKKFFSLCRTMNNRGATCIFLAHANKYRDKEDMLIPEGVGDVKNDTDDLIFLEREKKPNGIDITTVIDIAKGAKTRGIFNPISFHIDKNREVTMYEGALNLPDRAATKAKKATDDEILNIAESILIDVGDPICKSELVKKTHAVLRDIAGEQRIKDVLTINSCLKRDGEKSIQPFEYFKGDRNAQMFSTPPGY